MNNINDFEKLKKEIWYLNKVRIPSLEQMIEEGSSGDLSSLTNELTECKNDISTIENNISSLDTSITQINQNLTSIYSSINSINQEVDGHASDITSLQNISRSLSSSFSSLMNNMSSLENDMSNIESQYNTHDNLLASHSLSISNINNQLQSISDSISSLSSQLSSLETTVDSMVSGSGAPVIVYDKDSTDASINLGYTNGIVVGRTIKVDLSPYSSARIFANFNNCDLQTEIRLNNREATDFCAFTYTSLFTNYYFTKFFITNAKDKFTANFFAEVVINSDGTVSQTIKYNDADFYIYRIEGIY